MTEAKTEMEKIKNEIQQERKIKETNVDDAAFKAIIDKIEQRDPENPIKVDACQETSLQRSKRIRNYVQSGATALCNLCDKVLLFCECTGLEHGENVVYGWPASYTKEEK
eukprot:181446_1